ncbi:MAG: hypothetical protein IT230_04750 [Flavobacteriales bacterium]|nr:hypothetical protein [Flavobacteriales bacterium]
MNRLMAALVVAGLWYSACGRSSSPPSEKTGAGADPPENVTRCFLQVAKAAPSVAGGDTITATADSLVVRINLLGDLVNGIYEFTPGQKDRLSGTFQGHREGDLITALFTYHAGGTTGRVEVLFRLEPNGLRIGTGELIGDSIRVFKDRSNAVFGALVPEVACP